MSLLKRDHLLRFGIIAIVFSLTLLMTAPSAISQPCAVPPASGGTTILPNVLMLVDNSGSMLWAAYPASYSNGTNYYGLFEPGNNYSYDSTNNYFYENSGGQWSGNFLNWATMTRWDVAIYVLTGQNYKNAGSIRYLVSNADNRYYHSSFNDNHWYIDTDNVTPNNSTDSFLYQPVPHYFDTSLTDSRWSYLDVYDGSDHEYYYLRIRVASDYQPQGLLQSLEDKVRLGLMHFNGSDGGYIRRYINKLDSTQLDNVIADLHRTLAQDASEFTEYINHTWTPLAETLYEATRYFRQVDSAWSGDYWLATDTTPLPADPTRDPFYFSENSGTIWCVDNYVIIVTDGEATQDRDIPENDDASPARPLRDADNDSCDSNACPCEISTACATKYNCTDCSEYPYDSSDNYGSAYLDDVAHYAYNNDLRDDLINDQTITTHTVFVFGTSPGVGEALLENTADNSDGLYRLALNAPDLVDALAEIFEQITNDAAAAASTAITSETVSGADLIYIPYFKHPDDNQWWGNIRAFELDNDGNLIDNNGLVASDGLDDDGVLNDPIWDAAVELQSMDPNSRTIFTSISNTKVAFDASTVGKYFDVDLNGNSTEESAEIDALISYIRGTDNPGGFTLRGRNDNYLGDIIHASPAFVGKPSARYDMLYGDIDYWDFYWANDDRMQVLYAGANDGMLHCFDAANGQELWAYIPYNLLSHLKWLADPNYCHCYYVDLSATVRDIRVNGDWKSVLLGGMRLGGTPDAVDTTEPPNGSSDETLRSAFFAIDVTDPNDFLTSDAVLWEISNDSFGYTTSNPIPVKVGNTDTWYLVFGSGPKTRDGEGDPDPLGGGDGYTDNYAYIFVVNASTGDIEATIDVGALGQDNFFGPPVAIDYDLDYSVDMIYIGDAKGNLWRIKTFTGSGVGKTYIPDPNNWIIDVGGNASAPDPQPLLSLGTDQPITIKPTVSKDDNGRVWIYFGTGRYFCANDNTYCGEGNECATSGDCIESESVGDRSKFMAVGVYDRHWDSTAGEYVLQSGTLGLNDLDHRVIKQGYVVGSPGDYGYYIVDADTGQADTDVSTSTNGWYFHLLDAKERCLGDFTIYQEAVFFITFTPDDTDPCARGGLSSLYGVYYTSGTSTTNALFDLTGDENIDSDDLVTDGADLFGPAVKKLDEGFPGGGLQIKDDKGYTPLPDEPIDLNPPGDEGSTGVTSWREVLQ